MNGGKGGVAAGLDSLCFMSPANPRSVVERGKGFCHLLSAELKGRNLILGVVADRHGKEMISWESFQDTFSK